VSVRLLEGDCRDVLPRLPAASVHCVVTSPPYWGLRDYGVPGQLGLEPTPEAYVAAMVGVLRAVRRVLRDDGTLWLNMGDSYASGSSGDRTEGTNGRMFKCRPREPVESLKPKDLVGMPWRLAFALQADGWFLRADIIWAKPNPMPESVTDRPTKAHEYVFLLSKAARYFYDADAVREPHVDFARGANGARVGCQDERPELGVRTGTMNNIDRNGARREYNPAGRNLRSVWTLATEPTPESHFATFPTALASRCIQAGSSERGCCAACGAPWARQVEASPAYAAFCAAERARRGGMRADDLGRFGLTRGKSNPSVTADYQTTGWHPSCACDAPVVPCTVLDPFAGSGTVGAVAEQLGRHSILIELSPAYVRLADRRTAQLGLFTQGGLPAAGRAV
jgi:DNA modification methylase